MTEVVRFMDEKILLGEFEIFTNRSGSNLTRKIASWNNLWTFWCFLGLDEKPKYNAHITKFGRSFDQLDIYLLTKKLQWRQYFADVIHLVSFFKQLFLRRVQVTYKLLLIKIWVYFKKKSDLRLTLQRNTEKITNFATKEA